MKKKTIAIIIAVVILPIVLWFGMWLFVFTPLKVPTGSMANTIIPGETVICRRQVGEISRGDIIAFQYPPNPQVKYMQRVIGLPGEKIQIRGRYVYINDKELPEKRVMIELAYDHFDKQEPHKELVVEGQGKYSAYYEASSWDTNQKAPEHVAKFGVQEPFQIPFNSYFVMGDCRDNSQDSRYWGVVPKNNIVAKAAFIYPSPIVSRTFTSLEIK